MLYVCSEEAVMHLSYPDFLLVLHENDPFGFLYVLFVQLFCIFCLGTNTVMQKKSPLYSFRVHYHPYRSHTPE